MFSKWNMFSSTKNPVIVMSVDQEEVVSQQPATQPNSRKVSIVTHDGSTLHGHDNLGFESPRSRKVSSASEHAEMGPVRKKSILHNAHAFESQGNNLNNCAKYANGDARIKKHSVHSVTDSMHSRTRFSDVAEDEDQRIPCCGLMASWWYTFCIKCRSNEPPHPSWQPPMWNKLCPYPFCPTYRQFSRIIALCLIGILSWGIVYTVLGETAAPGGQLFQLILLTICAHLGGWLMSLTTLPALIGMLFVGLLFQNVGLVDFDKNFNEVTKELRKIALVIILIRAGLDLDPHALKRLKFTVIKLGLVPWLVEAGIIAITTHFFLDLPWIWGCLLGVIIAAVSPAVVVPCLFRLRSKGYGVAKGIPTLIIAVAGIDDATSVAIFGIMQSIMFSNDSLTMQILQGPISIVGGIGFGIIWGLISCYAPEKHDPFVVPLRILMLLVGGLIAVFGSERIGYGGAGPLGCVAAAFVSLVCWSKQGWEIEENPAVTAFEIFWMIFEPILFGITGAQIKISELDPNIVSIGIGCLIAGVVIRILATILVGIGCKLNLKEKIFVALSWMAKATVQAALGPVALILVTESGNEKDKIYADTVLMICVLSIMLTAPTGAILITLSGPRLLTKTKFPVVPEEWRRSHRPSIRDISIIDEEEEKDETLDSVHSENVIKEPNKGEP
ncbi:PREDICTED: mitochondrial sodium/hydrogen exchanger 9B2 isoform X2 [Nicrophorus vespilloides]|uniref:Mitochondrial sodium/hydrogen exchanger 9B2 isoform X2 n=1 Tax=Nicrophorus vespilloides TaxID=110193 RepID=A0ABM1NH27_NICVS|nr:PREDICTED: mitochondrial sodium/hydrogen exchanger 9B2 isoform X2 [Nicrophorus vespilloides]